jgi:hypothetical protein
MPSASFWCRYVGAMVCAGVCAGASAQAPTISDPAFDASVKAPAYVRNRPRVVIDEAHFNYHTSADRFRAFAQLLRNDGYDVRAGTARFEKAALQGIAVLVVANARGAAEGENAIAQPAFMSSECDIVREWVRAGGSLLLVADHAPFADAAARLATRFGVTLGKGYVFDIANSDFSPTILIFSAENGLLAEHPAVRGRSEAERVRRVVSFEGQSLQGPPGSVSLLTFSPTAYEAGTHSDLQQAQRVAGTRDRDSREAIDHTRSVAGLSQGLALEFGKGRLVVFGGAGLFSAQILRSGHAPDLKFGMNRHGNDDKQLALNVMHWLSRVPPK